MARPLATSPSCNPLSVGKADRQERRSGQLPRGLDRLDEPGDGRRDRLGEFDELDAGSVGGALVVDDCPASFSIGPVSQGRLVNYK